MWRGGKYEEWTVERRESLAARRVCDLVSLAYRMKGARAPVSGSMRYRTHAVHKTLHKNNQHLHHVFIHSNFPIMRPQPRSIHPFIHIHSNSSLALLNLSPSLIRTQSILPLPAIPAPGVNLSPCLSPHPTSRTSIVARTSVFPESRATDSPAGTAVVAKRV